MRRLLFDLTGLLYWYGFFSRPAGVQRVIEKLANSAPLRPTDPQAGRVRIDVEFVVRAPGTSQFYQVDAGLIRAIGDRRADVVVEFRRMFAQLMRATPTTALLAEARYFHIPYVALGAMRAERMLFSRRSDLQATSLQPVALPGSEDTLFNPGDLWWQKGYATAVRALKQRTGIRVVQMIHDFYVLEQPAWSPTGFSAVFRQQVEGAAPHVDRWITSSAQVKDKLEHALAKWSGRAKPITVLPMGWDSFANTRSSEPMTRKAILDRLAIGSRPYILFVGTIEPRKNLPALLEAMRSLRTRLRERVPALVVAGGYGWRAAAARRQLEQEVKSGNSFWFRNLTDEELHAVYKGARFTVMPSHGEGWGLSIQESIGLGVPCIATAGGAAREAGRGLAKYFDPANAGELERAIEEWIVDQSALARARDAIEIARKEQRFGTWDDAGRVLLDVAFGPDGSSPATMRSV